MADPSAARTRQTILVAGLGVLVLVFLVWRLASGSGGGRVDRQTAKHADEIKAQVMEPTPPAPPDPTQAPPTTDSGTAPTPVKKGSHPPG